MIRPQPARWFEAVCARDDAFVLLEALAARQCAEIEWHAGGGDERQAAAANQRLKDFAVAARQYRAYWPQPLLREAAQRTLPIAAFEEALARLRAWEAEAAPRIAQLQDCEAELGALAIVARVVDALEASAVDLGQLAGARGAIRARVLVYPIDAEPDIAPGVLVHRFVAARELHAVVVGAAAVVEALERDAVALRGRVVQPPPWLVRDPGSSRALAAARIATLEHDAASLRAALESGLAKHAVALALGDIARATWCFHNVGAVESAAGLARITGWTDDVERLAAAVEESGARALASFPPAPAGAIAPLMLRNPWWARPFELFIRLFGLPGREGVDPSVLLAIASPLIFGYMFGDAGQGLVLVVAGLALKRRYPLLRLLVPGGVAAIAFGLAFGCVFAREDVVSPLWLAPLAAPLGVLVVPLFAGALLLTTGLALAGLEAWWRRALPEWLRCEAGLVAVYLGLLLAFFHRAGLALATAGAVAFVGGRALQARRLAAAAAALGALAERTLQILVNTVSFARVGAFALAHAGLSAAVVALAHAAGDGIGAGLVLVAGNVVVIVLEGLVVGIQTTRLILFEFFVRFLESRGREFHPLLPPNVTEVHP